MRAVRLPLFQIPFEQSEPLPQTKEIWRKRRERSKSMVEPQKTQKFYNRIKIRKSGTRKPSAASGKDDPKTGGGSGTDTPAQRTGSGAGESAESESDFDEESGEDASKSSPPKSKSSAVPNLPDYGGAEPM